ncbi:MAG: hypothetical protein ABL984_02990 [Pyrinomonadaceae bacterium]
MKKLIALMTPALLVVVVLICFASNAKAQQSDIEQAITSLGFKVTWKITAAGADWELRDFKMREKRVFSIKSLKKVPREKNMYYRFGVQIEEYGSEADAEKRMEHIAATPPGPTSKLEAPEYDLREGFRRGKLVYVVSTVVYMFVVDKSLNKFRMQLEEKIPAT